LGESGLPAQKSMGSQTPNNPLGEIMKKLCLLFLALPLFANDAQEEDYPKTPLDNGLFIFVSLTPTNVVCKYPPYGNRYWITGVGVKKRMLEYDEEFAIPLDQEVTFYDGRHAEIIYTPILLANQQKGFRITYVSMIFGDVETFVRHVALSDTPVEVGEDDVEMIWKDGELRTLEEYQAIVQREKEERDAAKKFDERLSKAITERHETEADRLAFLNELNAMGSREAILAYLDELENENATPPPSRPTRRAWLWWLALPAVAVAWLVFYLGRK